METKDRYKQILAIVIIIGFGALALWVQSMEQDVTVEGYVKAKYGETLRDRSCIVVEGIDGQVYLIKPADDLFYKYNKGDYFYESIDPDNLEVL